jgi:putative SOS response-associated peptidase YedK
MCGRYGFFHPEDLPDRFDVDDQLPMFEAVSFEASYNITPGSVVPVITRETLAGAPARNRATLMKWGLVPFWAKDAQIGYRTINARAEGIAERPTFRKPIRTQRCLVPVDGFYEWQKTSRVGKADKVPHFIHLAGAETFAFAGLYDYWRDAEGRPLATFTIVTTGPNELMASIHNRMPVILSREDERAWLDPATPFDHVLALLRPYPAERMHAYPVSTLVNNPRNDGQQLITPA